MKYSIITVNLNNATGLEDTIQSVINQTCHDYEFLIIDGGSSDYSTSIIEHYKDQIHYCVSEPDNGIFNAMNKGIIASKGDYLIFMNSGDCFYAPDILEKVSLYHTDADFIIGKDYHYNEESQIGHASIQPPRTTMIHFFISTLDHQSSFIKKNMFNGSPYREDYRLVSDWIFFTEKIVKEQKQVQFIPEIICKREEGGLSEQFHKQNRKEIDAYLHQFLPSGIYNDYATLAKLDKTSIYRLFNICENGKMRKVLVFCIKIIHRFCH
jgi:glycosyltransferase involved in cell wall biosynthesis